MILPRRLALLVLVAFAVFASLTEAGTTASNSLRQAPEHKQAEQKARHHPGAKRAAQRWRQKMARGTAKVLKAVKASRTNPELRASSDIVPETKTYKAAMIYSWPNSKCLLRSYGATYFGTSCAAHEGGLSTRYNCVISKPHLPIGSTCVNWRCMLTYCVFVTRSRHRPNHWQADGRNPVPWL